MLAEIRKASHFLKEDAVLQLRSLLERIYEHADRMLKEDSTKAIGSTIDAIQSISACYEYDWTKEEGYVDFLGENVDYAGMPDLYILYISTKAENFMKELTEIFAQF